MTRPNPFHVLGLPTGATDEEVVHRGQELCELAESEEDSRLARWAIQELTTHPFTRRLHALLEVPGAEYGEQEWARFERRNRRNPVDLAALADGAPPLRPGDFDLRAVLGLVLDDVLSPPEIDLRPAVEHAPFPPGPGAPPIEVSDVIFG
jgi:hypothetical protein